MSRMELYGWLACLGPVMVGGVTLALLWERITWRDRGDGS